MPRVKLKASPISESTRSLAERRAVVSGKVMFADCNGSGANTMFSCSSGNKWNREQNN